ncbi:MAG TPA: family 10 glycosylhydrolase [Terriglobales bacterium]|nr:family 10 glycosylhydrolase [Terriglobales bacterium]
MKLSSMLCAFAIITGFAVNSTAQQAEQNWTHKVRIGAYGLNHSNVTLEQLVRNATEDHVYGIEVDNDIPGRYESFLDPAEKLDTLRKVSELAHKANNKIYVYIAGTECITAHADKAAHSVVKDHPDWLQRKITGEPAVFTGGAAFWIREGDEDVWISPYAPDWRKQYMQRVREIAATGLDGIYVDIPYWMTHFDGWENSWASFDQYTVAAFKEKTGLDAKKDLKLGDFQDPNFRKWLDFRIDTLTDFVKDIRDNARTVNPNIMVIPEIYPGIEEEATRVGSDVYEMYHVIDVIAHEYEFGNGGHMAAMRSQVDWFLYQAGMLSFRAFAEGKASWILNYSWDKQKEVTPQEPMKNLANSIIMTGCNFWDAPGHSMGGSNDRATRKVIFEWIEKNEKEFFSPRQPLNPVGVYFSPKSRDYTAKDFLPSYRGTMVLLIQQHRALQVVTPRTLAAYRGKTLILPSVGTLNDTEKQSLKSFVDQGGKLVVLGVDATGLPESAKKTVLANDPGKAYFNALESDFGAGSANAPKDLLDALGTNDDIQLDAPATVASNFAIVNGTPHVYLSNFGGLVPGKVVVPTPVDVHVKVPAAMGDTLSYLSFLGDTKVVHGVKHGDKVEFTLPPLERGAVVSFGAKK